MLLMPLLLMICSWGLRVMYSGSTPSLNLLLCPLLALPSLSL
uniref:Uncharacterized protein n=1 Tax=Setaria italica TaxID=4555 RepID=K3YF98_SETIT